MRLTVAGCRTPFNRTRTPSTSFTRDGAAAAVEGLVKLAPGGLGHFLGLVDDLEIDVHALEVGAARAGDAAPEERAVTCNPPTGSRVRIRRSGGGLAS